MSPRNKITVIIISYNRPKYLKRSVDYYIINGFNVIVLDGSKKSLNLDFHHKINKLQYIHLTKSYHERFIYAAKLLKTKYSILVNDDEFFFPEFIDKSINFLDKNKNYGTVCGIVFCFSIKKEKIKFYQGYTYFQKKINKSNLISERIKYSIHNPSVHGYNSVMRSTIFKGQAKLLTKIKHVKNIFFIELILNIFINSQAKSKFINNLAWFRSFENNWIQTKGWNRNTKFQNPYLWIKRQSKNKIRQYIQILAKEINLLNFQNLSVLIEENLYNYSLNFLNNFNNKSKKKNYILEYVKKNIKKNYLIYNLLKLVSSIIKAKEFNMNDNNLEIFLLSNKIQYKKKTLKSIIKIINNFYKENNILN
jgi:glycosyltransferase domain-containing protein